MKNILLITGALLAILYSGLASAYVGPGAGITMLAALWAVVVAVVLAIGSILFWPVRTLLRKRKAEAAKRADSQETVSDSDNADSSTHETESVERPDQ